MLLVLLSLACLSAGAQQFAPGYVDPQPVLQAAAKAIGTDNLKCVTISGTGYAGAVGQQRSDRNVDWPRGEPLANYTRTMNWDAKTMKEEFDRKPGMNPASWKYGAGWNGGTPLQQNSRQTFVVNGNYGWHIDGPGSTPVAGAAGRCRAMAARSVDQPARLPQGREDARRESEGGVALGAG